MEPSVRVVMEKLSKPKTELKNVKVDLSKDKLMNLFNESIELAVKAKFDARKLNKEFQSINNQNQKIRDKIQENRRQASRIANDMIAAYKVIGEKPPVFLGNAVDGISDAVGDTPVSNYANVFSV